MFYNFKQNYTYKITLVSRNATGGSNPAGLKVCIGDNGSGNNCDGVELITNVYGIKTGFIDISSNIFLENGYNFNEPLSTASNYLRISSYKIGESGANPSYQTMEIKKVIIEEFAPIVTFTLSPTTLSLGCGDTNVKNFTVTPANIPAGATVTYQWSFSGWTGSSTTNSINLTPNPGSTLPSSVTVTPFINGAAKPSMTCTVSRATFNPTLSSITGNANLCPSTSATYALSNLGSNSVTWTSSNTAAATIGASSGATVTVNGIQEGTTVLTATILNSCNQIATKTFSINIGKAKITNYEILGGHDNVPVGSTSFLSVTAATNATSYSWSIVPFSVPMCSGPTPTIYGNGLLSRTINWGECIGLFLVRCQVLNSCGSVFYTDKIVRVFNSDNNPCPLANFNLGKNPIKSGDPIELKIVNDPNLIPCDNSELRMLSNIKIYDLNSNQVYSENYENLKEVKISNLKLEKGFYIILTTAADGSISREKLLVE